MRTRSISKYHFQYRYVVFFEITRDYYATSARALSLSLSCFSKFADSLDSEDLRRLAKKPNQGQTGIPRINLVSECPTLRPMHRKNIISDFGFEPMRTIRWVHSYLKEKQKFKQVRTTNLVFHACSAPFHARVQWNCYFIFHANPWEEETQLGNYV